MSLKKFEPVAREQIFVRRVVQFYDDFVQIPAGA